MVEFIAGIGIPLFFVGMIGFIVIMAMRSQKKAVRLTEDFVAVTRENTAAVKENTELLRKLLSDKTEGR
ncbi:hypothetical protein J2T09_001444 [Neorhizobium huautlense]|uniref:Uncharacterized protein n=1 Tax=Neorhizobium huautlense TaxID=67774 RepID=A0ABT9PQF8_9HYPH|nr:hypothetical protein [Neorhizobium huautlense]MDP9836699.1 hypothetical protein [Neorhizobium huautlense]